MLSAMHDLTLAGQYADRLLLLTAAGWSRAGRPTEMLTEELIARHYGADVRVVMDEDGPASRSSRSARDDGR